MSRIVLLSVLSLFVITGCHNLGGGVMVGGSYSHGHNVPPVHAPAHGLRSHYRYQYYPNAEFYFDIGRNLYFYLDSNARWSFSVTLPLHLRHHLHNNYVEIEMEADRPYLRHKDHKNKYKKHNTRYNQKDKYKSHKKKYKRYDDEEEKKGRGNKKRKYERE